MATADQTGQFFVVKTGGVAAWLIRFGTRSQWNHAGVIVSPGGDTVEANPPQVGYGRLGRYKTVKVSNIAMTDTQRAAVVRAAKATVGKRYGWLDIICCALLALGVHWKPVEQRAARSDTADCSCDVARIYAAANINLALGKPPYAVTPGDLADIIDGVRVPADY